MATENQAPAFALYADSPPLRTDVGGAIRVGKSRILLDLIVLEYENGMTPEDMIRAYDSLELSDVYGAIAYYLRHPVEVKTYLDRRKEEAARLQSMIESQKPQRPTKEELLARRGAADHVEARQ